MSEQSGYAIDDMLTAPLHAAPGRYFRAAARILEFVAVPTSDDASSPVLTPISPAPGSPLRPSQAVVVRLQDNKGFALREIWARFSSANAWEMVYGDGAFTERYEASEVAAEFGTPGPAYYDRRTYTVRRSGGWPSTASVVRLRFTVVDQSGNTLVLSS